MTTVNFWRAVAGMMRPAKPTPPTAHSGRLILTLIFMLLTASTVWAIKTETASYRITAGSTISIYQGTISQTDSWNATYSQNNYYWEAGESHKLANDMTIEPDVDVLSTSILKTKLTTPTKFTFTAPDDIIITSVTFKMGDYNVAASSTSSEPGKTFDVTLGGNTGFSGFVVTFGKISGDCGTNATWTLSKQDGQYTALTISGSGDMSDYSSSDAPWGCDLTSATIGSGITAIGDYAFTGCDALTEVTIQKNDGLVTLGTGVFNGCNDDILTIVVPNPELAVQYQSATNWSTHASKLRVALGGYLFAATNEGGTAAYAITNETDLRNLSSIIKDKYEGIANGRTFRQTSDIALSSTNFYPIGGKNYYHYFSGNYDGGGNTISGLCFEQSTEPCNYLGLFGYVQNGSVKNVRLVNPNIHLTDEYCLSALIGRTNNATVENCVVINPSITGGKSTTHNGIIIGDNSSSTLRNLYYYGGNYDVIGEGYSGTNVGRARKVTLGSGIGSVTPAATDITNGFVYNNERYYREGLALTLTSNLSTPTGQHAAYKANGNAFDGSTYTINSTDGDVTLTAELIYNTYSVVFNGNGNTAGEMSNQAFTYGTAQTLTANAFTRTGYTFDGWATSADGEVVYADLQSVNNLTTTNGGTVTLYAKWTPITYTVVFNGNGATDGSMNDMNFTYDEAQNLTANGFTRTGYTFAGWDTSANGEVVYTDQQRVSNLTATDGGTVNLYANWTPITYTVQFNGNGSTSGSMSNQSFTYDVAQTLTANGFTRMGYTVTYDYNEATGGNNDANATATATFNGWATSTDGDVVYTDQQSVINLANGEGDTVDLFANWTDNSVTLPTPTKTGYTFSGWYSDAGLTTSVGAAGASYSPTADITLYAHWTPITYTVTYDLAGGTVATANPTSYNIETATFTLTNPSRTGYTFTGWTGSNGNTPQTEVIISQGTINNLNYTANWTAHTYTVHFDKNHEDATGSMSNQNFTYDEAQNLTVNAFTRTDYDFTGWNTQADGNGNSYTDQQSVQNLTATDKGTVTLYAMWTLHVYSITYHLNGGTFSTNKNSFTIESDAITLDNPTRTGYTFGGWYTNEGLTGDAVTTIAAGSTENKEFWAKWTPITYTVHFDKNHNDATGSMSDMNFTYDEAQNLTANCFNRTGHAFVGWATSADGPVIYTDQQSVSNLTTINHGEVTLYAKWGIPYIDANGDTQICRNYTMLTSSTDISNLSPGWYVVDGEVSYSSELNCYGDMHLILCDGANINVSNDYDATIYIQDGDLTIYAQSTGSSMGQLNVSGSFGIYDSNGNVTICGGKVSVTGCSRGISSSNKDIFIHGGQVSTSGRISAEWGRIYLDLHNATDYFQANSYYVFHAINITDGQTIIDDLGYTYSGELPAAEINANVIAGRTLMPGIALLDHAENNSLISNLDREVVNVALSGRKLWKDGDWNTLCLPFSLSAEQIAASPLAGADIRALVPGTSGLSQDGKTLTLNFTPATGEGAVTSIVAGQPYLVKWTPTNCIPREKPVVDGGQTSNWGELGSENYDKLVDGDTSTKYGLSNANPRVEFHYSRAIIPIGYALWTANDTEGARNPKTWTIKGKNSGDSDWTTLVTVDNSNKDKLPMANGQCTVFDLPNSAAYQYFCFEAEKADGADGFQLAELQFYTQYIDYPVFAGVTFDKTNRDVESSDGKVTFKGNYDYQRFSSENRSILFLGADNTLYWPEPDLSDPSNLVYPSIGACRAYFQLNSSAGVREFCLNFGEGDAEASGIVEAEANSSKATGRRDSGNLFTLHSSLSEWYDLSGRKLNGKPTTPGLYIHNGRKVCLRRAEAGRALMNNE